MLGPAAGDQKGDVVAIAMSPRQRMGLEMALFGMVWLLRVRSEMRRCAKCRREQQQRAHLEDRASQATFFTIDAPGPAPVPEPGHSLSAPTTFCEVHGFMTPKDDIQEFYELTLLDETKSVQQKTAETIRIANKWEASDGPIAPTYGNNDKSRYIVEEESIPVAPSPPPTQPLNESPVPVTSLPAPDGVVRRDSVDRSVSTERVLTPRHVPVNDAATTTFIGVQSIGGVKGGGNAAMPPTNSNADMCSLCPRRKPPPKKLVRFDSLVDTFSISECNSNQNSIKGNDSWQGHDSDQVCFFL